MKIVRNLTSALNNLGGLTLCSKKYVIKPTRVFSSDLYFIAISCEMLRSKGACSNSPIYSRLYFYDIYVQIVPVIV